MNEKQKKLVRIAALAMFIVPYSIKTEQKADKKILKLKSLTWETEFPVCLKRKEKKNEKK